MTAEDQQVVAEAERIQSAKGSSVSSMLAAGAGYSRKPTLSVSVSVHLAEVETREDAAPTSYYVKIRRGAKKFTTEGAKAVPSETLVSSGAGDSHGRFGSQGGRVVARLEHRRRERRRGRRRARARALPRRARNAHARSASAAVPGSSSSRASAGLTSPGGAFLTPKSVGAGEKSVGHGRRASDFPVDYAGPSVEKKWMCRPVWGGIRAPGRIRQARRRRRARARVGGVAQRGSRSKSVLGQGVIPDVLAFADGHLHTVQPPLAHPRSGDVVGVIHLRVRCTRLNEHVVAADKDFNPDASLLTAPSTYTKRFALNAADVLASGASGVASVARAGLGTINPIPKKYVDGAANGMPPRAGAVNAPARRGRWAFRSMYKGCEKM